MRVVVSGASGLIGSALVRELASHGHQVQRLVRGRNADGIRWDPDEGKVDIQGMEGVDAVVHLAGESIAKGRWTQQRKETIRSSRVNGTQALAKAIVELKSKPAVLVSASAIGYYGNRGDQELSEESEAGTGYLADVCRQWEEAARQVERVGVRVVLARMGMVLSGRGGALPPMLRAFGLGVGGLVGSGEQYMSWVSEADAVGAVVHALATDQLQGAMNVVAPGAVRNREFVETLGTVLRRPTWFRVPSVVVRAALGEMGEALLLEGARVVPKVLQDTGYGFAHPGLEGAIRAAVAMGR